MYHLAAIAAITASALAAQNVYVQPAGYAGVEANNSTTVPFSYVGVRMQQSDANRIGLPLPAISALAFRRDRNAGTSGFARTVDVTIAMGKNDFATFSSTFASNWRSPPTTVYTTKPTNLPDITQAPPVPPAPFAIAIPLDQTFHYDGVDSLMWELLVDNGGSLLYALDWSTAAVRTAGPPSTALGTGCPTGNGTMALSAGSAATATDLTLAFAVAAAPSAAPIVLALGRTDPALALPGLCALLHTDALLQVPLGTANGSGDLSSVVLSAPWNDSLRNAVLCAQTLAPDATQAGLPIALSDGRRLQLPATRGGPSPAGCKLTYSTAGSGSLVGVTPTTSAVVTQISY